MQTTYGNGSMPLRIGNLINTKVWGGPIRDREHHWSVKMAAEISQEEVTSEVWIKTKDFCVPEVSDVQAGVVRALMAMITGESVYVGCMGGIGRTGLFLAALAKVQIEYRKSKHRKGRGDDPVAYVREHFIPHAVETQEQQNFIADLNVSAIVDWLDMTQVAMGMGGMSKRTAIYDSHEEVPLDFQSFEIKGTSPTEVDDYDGPAVTGTERISADYKQGRIELQSQYIEERDAEAEKSLSDEEEAMLILWKSLHTQIIELRAHVDADHDTLVNLQRACKAGLEEAIQPLTKPSWFARIRKWIRK